MRPSGAAAVKNQAPPPSPLHSKDAYIGTTYIGAMDYPGRRAGFVCVRLSLSSVGETRRHSNQIEISSESRGDRLCSRGAKRKRSLAISSAVVGVFRPVCARCSLHIALRLRRVFRSNGSQTSLIAELICARMATRNKPASTLYAYAARLCARARARLHSDDVYARFRE